MFKGCSDINNFDFSEFDTSQVTSMDSMFSGCSSISSLNLHNFNTSQVTNMNRMFYQCSSIKSLNLSNFDTSKVTSMKNMFDGCSSLKLLNLSNCDISNLAENSDIFLGCDSLVILYLPYSPSFNFLINLQDINQNLEYINIKYDEIPNDFNMIKAYIINALTTNIVICILKNNEIYNLSPNCVISDCSDDWRNKRKELIQLMVNALIIVVLVIIIMNTMENAMKYALLIQE